MTPIIRTENLVKRFGRQAALDGVSFDVPPGVVFGLLGENGAGKTTLIRILLGLLRADAGRSSVLGLDPVGQGLEIRRRTGYVPEVLHLYDWMTVDQIGWFSAPFYPAGYLSEYRRLIQRFGLAPRRRIDALSKGMKAKVGLALALAHEPELLVLDEPTSGLDAIIRREFLESMVDLAAAGRTVFLSSHQIHEVERVADVVAIIKEGRLLVVEPLERLKEQVRRLVITADAWSPVSTVPGELLSRERRGRQCELLVRATHPAVLERWVATLAADDVEVHAPTLEEIFVAYMQGGRALAAGGEAPAAEQAPTQTDRAPSIDLPEHKADGD